MKEEIRKTGIDIIGDARWGTHFCQFYETKEDLIDVLVPYFKAGLENNEFCMWVTSEPLSEEEAKKAMRKALPNFDRHLKKGQIEIIAFTEWYLKDGAFNLQRVLNAWIDKLDQALAKGYDGIRVTGNTAWLEKKDWRSFADYEEEVNDVIGKYRMIAICSYPLDKCGASEVIDVVRNHRFALVRRMGRWELIESSGLKRTEEALRQSEEKYRSLVENIPDVIWTLDSEDNTIFLSHNVEKVLGFTPEEIYQAGKNFWHERTHPDDRESVKEAYNLLFTRNKMFDIEYRVQRKDGRWIWIQDRAVATYKKGGITYADGVFFDITERKKAEKSVRESQQKFERLFKSNPEATVFSDSNERVLNINPCFSELFGYSLEEAKGKLLDDLIVPRDLKKEAKMLTEKNREGYVYHETVRQRKDGSLVSVFISAAPIIFEDQYLGNITLYKDMTERRRAEEALRESEEKFRNIFESANDCMAYLDKSGRILDVNEKTVEVFGGSKEELLGKHFTRLGVLSPRDIPIAMSAFAKVLAGKKPTVNVRIKNKKGREIHAEVSASVMKIDNELAGILVIARDVTERKMMEGKLKEYTERLEEKVEERTRELEEAQEQLLKSERLAAIGEVAAMVGHDLRNPLQSIENATYYLNNELPHLSPSIPIPQKVIEMLKVINDSVNYADEIIRDLQDFAVTKKPILKKTDVNAIVKETLSQVEAPENVKLITELGHLPEIKADKDMIKRVFLNLAVNGIQAIENGGTLKVSTKKTKGFVEAIFKDTGIGVSKENMEKLFTPFFTTRAKGMGMGLPICKKFVDAHGGSIEVESEEGKGSTFTVRLPIQ